MASEFSMDLNGVRAVSVRVVMTYRGVWWAEVDLDPDSAPVTSTDIPTGPCVVTIPPGGTPITLKGTVDPQEGGRFLSGVKVHVLAGGGGWATAIPGQHFQNTNGVSSLTVEQATAASIGETVNDPAPVSLGTDWVREGSDDHPRPASTIFGDRQWYVDTAGVTQVQAWPTTPQDSSIEVLNWDPLQQRGDVAADVLVVPGTVLTDARFDGPITVRDVEQVFDAEGTRATVWCSSQAVTRLISALNQMVRTFGNNSPLTRWTYRVVTQDGATFSLQAVANSDGSKSPQPDLTNIQVWPGMAGLSCKAQLSQNVGVIFRNGDRSSPVIVDFDGTLPMEVTMDAQNVVHVGPTATSVELSGGGNPIARVGDTVVVMFPPLCPIAGTISGVPIVGGVVTFTSPAIGTIMTGSGKASAGFATVGAMLAALVLGLVLQVLSWGHGANP